MKCKAQPYEGSEPYLFLSYCHADAELVYPIIEQMAEDGFRIWYDDGIHVGDDWPQKIATHLNDSLLCVAAITQNADNSHNCRSEILFSMNHNKKLIPVFLEEFSITPALEYLLGAIQYIKKYELQNESVFYEKLYHTEQIEQCRGRVSLLKKDPKSERKETIETSEIRESLPKEQIKQKKREIIQDVENISNPEGLKLCEDEKEKTEEVKEIVQRDVSEERTQKAIQTEVNKEKLEKQIQQKINELEEIQMEEENGEDPTITVDPTNTKLNIEPKSIDRIAIFGCFSKQKMFLLNKKKHKIGRSIKKCDVVLDNPAISSLHAVIFYESDKFYIRDSDSTNGTILNLTERIEALQPIELDTYTLISLSSSELCLFAKDNFAKWIIKNKKCAVLECEETEEFMVIDSEDALLFGRLNKWPKGALSDKHINREIGYIFLEEDKCFLEMMNKKEVIKIFLNERLLMPSETVELQDGDELVMGMGGIYHIKFHWLQLEMGE